MSISMPKRAPSRAPDPAGSSGTGSPFRALMLRLHFYAGILVAPFILIATISGGLYAAAPTIEQFVYRDYLRVESGGDPIPVAEQIASAQRERPDLALAAVRPAPAPGDSTKVLFTDPTLGDGKHLAVFVDPGTGATLGEAAVYGRDALPLRTWISQLHRDLHLGEPGRLYSELAASWLWVIALGGIYLWVGRYLRARRSNSSAARLLTPDLNAKGRRRTLSWHGVVGLWIGVGLLFLSATGLTWSTYAGENVGAMREALRWTTPTLTTSLSSATPSDGDNHSSHGSDAGESFSEVDDRTGVAGIDSILAIAQHHGLDGAVEVRFPATTDTAYTVTEVRTPWVFGTDSIAVDGQTGTVTDTLRFADWPLAAKLTSWGIALHMGLLFGLANQLALLALAVALTTVIVRGYLMWWRRRPTRGSQWSVGRPPPRGSIRRLPAWRVAAGVAVAVAVGWFVPLLGVSLLGFVLIDAMIGAYQRSRA
ncbi:peptidase [Rhodococcus sp. WMMA185]|uniref:PepSY-associated TM helix domain-containing protein n=1 Tax=Rhodococcus sp. WMMA185 TaxID=679318 RepID=UPI0008785290|nr:PepSY domain-containing protein [Rhodococcus sp. WMMA185]AOW93378.1 peptidase [Rhodococcus sp. WMMA185]